MTLCHGFACLSDFLSHLKYFPFFQNMGTLYVISISTTNWKWSSFIIDDMGQVSHELPRPTTDPWSTDNRSRCKLATIKNLQPMHNDNQVIHRILLTQIIVVLTLQQTQKLSNKIPIVLQTLI